MSRTIWVLCLTLLVLGCEKSGGSDGGDGGPGGDGDTDQNGNTDDTVFEGDSGQLTDDRDGKTYPWVRIGDQIWMAEDLAFMPQSGEGFMLRSEEVSFPFGMFYTWTTMMDISSDYLTDWFNDETPRQGLCPAGFRIPSLDDWEHLAENVNELLGPFTLEDGEWMGMGHILKATTGWLESFVGNNVPMGTDDLGFSAYPAGYLFPDGEMRGLGHEVYFWSSIESFNSMDSQYSDAILTGLSTYDDAFYIDATWGKDYHYPVRCLRD